MPPAMSTAENAAQMDDTHYSSRNIAFRAAHGITSIVDNLVQHDQLKYCPAFMYATPPAPRSPPCGS